MVLVSFDGREIFDFLGDSTLDDLSIRRFDEPELVDPGIGRQRRDQADIRTFRRLDRTDAAVVGRMHVADFESRALPCQSARPKRGQSPLVGDLREGIGLIHKLGQLAAAEKLLDRRHDRFRIDQVMRQHGLHIQQIHPLFDAALHPHQAQTELILQQFAHRPDAPIAQMIDVVDLTLARS